MAEPQTIFNGTLTAFDVVVDSVTDGTLGTGLKQYVAIMDGTINSTNKQIVTAAGNAQVGIGTKVPAYTEGETDASIDGVPLLWEDTSDTLRPASAAKPLPVNIITGAVAGIQYTEADVDTTITGTAVMWEDTGDTMRPASAAKPLPVNVVAGSAAGTQYTEADTDASITGTAVLWEDTGDTLRVSSAATPFPTNVVVSSINTDSVAAGLVLGATPPTGFTALSPIRIISAASNNATSVKSSAGQLAWLHVTNINTSPRYLKLYNKASAPAPATDNALLVHTFLIPGDASGRGFVLPLSYPITFSTGIALAIVTGVSDTDNTAVAANEIIVNGGYR